MTKYLKTSKAREDAIYQSIVWACIDQLTDSGSFSMDDIMDEVELVRVTRDAFGAVNIEPVGIMVQPAVFMGNSIRWDYVRQFIEEEMADDLIPVSAAFFKRHQVEKEKLAPEKYLAGGGSKKCTGYALACRENGHLAEKHYGDVIRRSVGSVKSTMKRVARTGKKVVDFEKRLALPKIDAAS